MTDITEIIIHIAANHHGDSVHRTYTADKKWWKTLTAKNG